VPHASSRQLDADELDARVDEGRAATRAIAESDPAPAPVRWSASRPDQRRLLRDEPTRTPTPAAMAITCQGFSCT